MYMYTTLPVPRDPALKSIGDIESNLLHRIEHRLQPTAKINWSSVATAALHWVCPSEAAFPRHTNRVHPHIRRIPYILYTYTHPGLVLERSRQGPAAGCRSLAVSGFLADKGGRVRGFRWWLRIIRRRSMVAGLPLLLPGQNGWLRALANGKSVLLYALTGEIKHSIVW